MFKYKQGYRVYYMSWFQCITQIDEIIYCCKPSVRCPGIWVYGLFDYVLSSYWALWCDCKYHAGWCRDRRDRCANIILSISCWQYHIVNIMLTICLKAYFQGAPISRQCPPTIKAFSQVPQLPWTQPWGTWLHSSALWGPIMGSTLWTPQYACPNTPQFWTCSLSMTLFVLSQDMRLMDAIGWGWPHHNDQTTIKCQGSILYFETLRLWPQDYILLQIETVPCDSDQGILGSDVYFLAPFDFLRGQ